MVRGGTLFENALTSCPLCSPARGTLLTGLRSGIEAGSAAGYRVGYFGKWHLGPDGPRQRGAAESSPRVRVVRGKLAFNFVGDGLRDAADPYTR